MLHPSGISLRDEDLHQDTKYHRDPGEQRIEVGAEENTEIRRILRCPVIVVDHCLRLHVLQVVRALEGGGMEVGRIERAVGDHHRREELVLEADPLDLGLALLGVVAGFGKILDRASGILVIERGITLLEHPALLLTVEILLPCETEITVIALYDGELYSSHHAHPHHITLALGKRVFYSPESVGGHIKRHQHSRIAELPRREIELGSLHRRRKRNLEIESISCLPSEQHHRILHLLGFVGTVLGVVFLELRPL